MVLYPNCSSAHIMGTVLAGGTSRRMGQTDKFLLPLGNRRVIDHVIAQATPQVRSLMINANGPPERLGLPGHVIIGDEQEDGGPLAGLIASLKHVQGQTNWLMAFAADTPFISPTLVEDLASRASGYQVIYAQHGGNSHYTQSLWSTDTITVLDHAFAKGMRSLHKAVALFHNYAWHASTNPMSFFNINTPQDLQKAQAYLRTLDAHTKD